MKTTVKQRPSTSSSQSEIGPFLRWGRMFANSYMAELGVQKTAKQPEVSGLAGRLQQKGTRQGK